ncbi:Hint domain-containing protein [Nereida sp. MMG025]|uniref:Hint domain-containing protein n=1 Tax=Nereida sp. MMG025 TaxID=2909981 RepID=UPI001F45E93F|nr:Hint domain-containing protein [Nereida sp. MMG025]MCF6444148.1 Hint domain-containing protein [Nereida sp. MMG025]
MAFISEIHYKNVVANGTGVAEYVEVTVPPAQMGRLSDFTIATYQGDGQLAAAVTLNTLTPVLDPSTGWYVFTFQTAVTDPNSGSGPNGSGSEAEAVAFIDAAGNPTVQNFVDIGGGTTAITAANGPAAGAVSSNITPSAGNTSIQFDFNGTRIDGPITQNTSVVCLTDGTMIDTMDGIRPIEDLKVGDRIITRDRGSQKLRMIVSRKLGADDLRRNRALRPVKISQGALGFGLPRRDLWVSPQHRMLYSNMRVPLTFGEEAIFVRAKSLCATFDGCYVDANRTAVTYYHLIFDNHEVIYAEGAATESFDAGTQAVAALDPETRVELYSLFPELRVGQPMHQNDFITVRSWELMALAA